jgi:hypothetical protein
MTQVSIQVVSEKGTGYLPEIMEIHEFFNQQAEEYIKAFLER